MQKPTETLISHQHYFLIKTFARKLNIKRAHMGTFDKNASEFVMNNCNVDKIFQFKITN